MKAIFFRFSTYTKFVEQISTNNKLPKLNYESHYKPALDIYQSLGFNENIIKRIYKERPLSLVQVDEHTNIGQFNELLKKRFNADAKNLRSILFKDPTIMSNSIEQLNNCFDLLENTLKISKEGILNMLINYPLFMRKFDTNYQKIRNIFNTYAHINDQQFGKIIMNTPFLFSFHLETIPQKFRNMYNRQYTVDEIQQLLQINAEFIGLKPNEFDRLLNHYDVLIPDSDAKFKLLLENPKLLQLVPSFMLDPKINLFKEQGLSINQIGQCLQICPNIFIQSVASLKQKLTFFEKYLKVKIIDSSDFPKILDFDYWTILRPRLVILNTIENGLQNMKMSQEEFIKKYDCEQRYLELLKEEPERKKKDADFLIRNIQSTRIRSKQSITVQQEKDDDIIMMSHKQQAVYVLNFTDAYDVDVFDDSDSEIPIETPLPKLNNQNIETLVVKNQCVGFPKYPQLNEIISYNLSNAAEDSYYTDMVTLSEYSNLFIMTQELLLLQIKLRCGDHQWIAQESKNIFDLKNILKLENNDIKTNALFSCPKKHLNCLIITPYGGLWMSKFSDFDSNDMPNQPILETKIQIRKIVKKVTTYQEYLAVAVGEEGVDLYSYEQQDQDIYRRHIHFIQNINKQLFNQPSINIISVKIDNQKLYCLDEIQGLFIFNIKDIIHPQLIMDIHIPRTVAFEVHQNTFLIVAQTPTNIEYILEIFVDFNDHTYFVNRVVVEDFTYRDIQINKNYAFIIGEETHLIIKHSIFNGFVKYNKELVRTFTQNQLIRFELYSKSNQLNELRFKDTSYYIGLSRKAIHVWKFIDYHAFLLCNFDQKAEHSFEIRFNSTTCESNQNREDLFYQCQTIQEIDVHVSGPLFYSDMFTILIFILIFAGLILCIICICVCMRWKKLVKELEDNRYQLSEMKKYGQLPEVDQNQI